MMYVSKKGIVKGQITTLERGKFGRRTPKRLRNEVEWISDQF